MTRSLHAICLITAAIVAGPAAGALSASSPLDGRWTFTWTQAQANPGGGHAVPSGRFVVELRHGHVTRLQPRPVLRGGRFTTRGNLATFVFPAPAPPGAVAGRVYAMHWSIYRDRLTWSRAPGRAAMNIFFVTPWTRIG